ncbi:MAG: sugar phosphate isomerase/epimerase family protein [Oscillospiraceae bacterium]
MTPIQIGVGSRSFPELTHRETAELLERTGATSTELCLHSADTKYWVYNGRSDLSTLSDSAFREIVETYRGHGIEVPALGVFTNLIDPDEKELRQNLDYYRRHLELAAANGIPYVSTECGFTPHQRGVNTDRYEDDFQRIVDSLGTLCGWAAEYGVSIALETCVIDVVPSAKRAADLHGQVGSPSLKFLLDPANLIANSSEWDMFYYLAPHVAYFHGKDRKVNDVMGRVVGDGDINWPLFLSLYHKWCEGKPFILEYVKRDNFEEIMTRVRLYDEKARAEMERTKSI